MRALRAMLMLSPASRASTVEWIREVGLYESDHTEVPADEFDGTRLEVELRDVPSVLLSYDHELLVTRIGDFGVLFYLSAPLRGPESTLGKPDGYLLVPMENVVSLNTFGQAHTSTVHSYAGGEAGPQACFPVSISDPGELVERLLQIERGVDVTEIDSLAIRLKTATKDVVSMLGLSSSSILRKRKRDQPLMGGEASRVLGLSYLLDQVQGMVAESETLGGFDVGRWFYEWMNDPLPAFGFRRPVEYINTFEGQLLVSNLLARMRAGTYS